ncbi:hemicentin-1-like [Orbicella faveolata]|uniref:hemicentin-1-like n=1 Tax=Orbicella faveolata TaxID=48498 RepID=UPI0009E3A24B|nr:hemicentin-1-like [Orbicella faveolata]
MVLSILPQTLQAMGFPLLLLFLSWLTNITVNYHDRATLFYLFSFLARPSIYYVDPPTETGTEENVTLTCQADGLPQPTFSWITPDGHAVNATAPVNKSGELDDGSENRRGKILQKDGSLLIFNTRDADQGVYKCVAKNVMGQDERRVNLTVKEDLVGVDVAITIMDKVFDKDLENKSSTRYKTLENQVEQELTTLFQGIEGFEKVIILGFL